MIKTKATLLFVLMIFNTTCFAYDWDKCRREMEQRTKFGGPYGGLATTSIMPTQYLSSWGGCSLIGKPEEDRKAFFNDNYTMLKKNFSENNGEYMYAFVSFFGCSKDGEDEFIKLIRNNYQKVFGKIYNRFDLDLNYPDNRRKINDQWNESWDVNPEQSFERIKTLITANESISKKCTNLDNGNFSLPTIK